MMKKLFIGLAFLLYHLSSFAQDQMVMDEHASVRELNEKFNKIAISQNIKLIISQGNDIALAVSASQEKYKDNIKTEVKNGTLNIYSGGDSRWSSKAQNLTVYLSFKEIESIEASGASDVIVLGVLNLKKINIGLSGASKLRASFKVELLMMDLSGACKANMQGNVVQLNIECSGASDVNGYKLEAEKANVNASGASDIMITVTKELNAEASGASHIYYKGNATVTNVREGGVSKILHTQ